MFIKEIRKIYNIIGLNILVLIDVFYRSGHSLATSSQCDFVFRVSVIGYREKLIFHLTIFIILKKKLKYLG